MIFSNIFKLMQITATQMLAHIQSILFQFSNPSKDETFNERVVSGKLQSHSFIGLAGRLV